MENETAQVIERLDATYQAILRNDVIAIGQRSAQRGIIVGIVLEVREHTISILRLTRGWMPGGNRGLWYWEKTVCREPGNTYVTGQSIADVHARYGDMTREEYRERYEAAYTVWKEAQQRKEQEIVNEKQ